MEKLNINIETRRSYSWDEIKILCNYNKIKIKSISKYFPYKDITYMGKYIKNIFVLYNSKNLLKSKDILEIINYKIEQGCGKKLSKKQLSKFREIGELVGIRKNGINYFSPKDIDIFVDKYLKTFSVISVASMLKTDEAKKLNLTNAKLHKYLINFRKLKLIEKPSRNSLYKEDLKVVWKLINKIQGCDNDI